MNILRSFAIAIMCMLASSKILANADIIGGVLDRNIYIESYHGPMGESEQLKEIFLLETFKEINKKYFNDTAYLVIRFGLYRSYYGEMLFPDIRPYCLGYDNFVFTAFDKNDNPTGYVKHKAIILTVSTSTIDLKECLSLIMYGLNNVKEISGQQRTIIGMSFFNSYSNKLFDFDKSYSNGDRKLIKTISANSTRTILGKHQPIIDSLLNKKFFRSKYYKDGNRLVGIYLQHNSVYVYERFKEEDRFNAKRKLLPDAQTGKIIYTSRSIKYVTPDTSNNYLIVSNDSFLIYQLAQKNLTRPTLLPSLDTSLHMKGYVENFSKDKNGKYFTIRMSTSYFGDYSIKYDMAKNSGFIDTNSYDHTLQGYIRDEKRIQAQGRTLYHPTVKLVTVFH